jgi:putative ABC transport system permease protein
MTTPLAWYNLIHSWVRTIVALAGVAFSVLLIFMQLGFLGAVGTSATSLYDELDFDILLTSPDYLHAADPSTFPEMRTYQAADVAGVSSVVPLSVELNEWWNPQENKGQRRAILVLGVDPTKITFKNVEMAEQSKELHRPDQVLANRESRREFGPENDQFYSKLDIGKAAELGPNQVEIAGLFSLQTGLSADGAVITNEQGFFRAFPGRPLDRVSMGLVKLENPKSRETVAKELKRRLPADVLVRTRGDVYYDEYEHWIVRTSLGLIFATGVILSFFVGTAIVYLVLANDVENHMVEYATLKAMGYTNWYLSALVFKQATLLAAVGYVPGYILSEVLYRATSYFANAPIFMTWQRAVFVFALTVVMCAASGLAALRKAHTAEPASLF